VIVLVFGLTLGAACAQGHGDTKLAPAAIDYPLPAFDRRVHVAPDLTDGAARQLGARIADVDGVAAAEVDYAERVIRVVLEPGLSAGDRDRTTGAVRVLGGVVSMDGGQ
jgi:hypothetical protein